MPRDSQVPGTGEPHVEQPQLLGTRLLPGDQGQLVPVPGTSTHVQHPAVRGVHIRKSTTQVHLCDTDLRQEHYWELQPLGRVHGAYPDRCLVRRQPGGQLTRRPRCLRAQPGLEAVEAGGPRGRQQFADLGEVGQAAFPIAEMRQVRGSADQ